MKKNLERLIKLIPIILNIYIAIVILYSFNDIEMGGSQCLFGHSLIFDVLLLLSSYYHKFCSWHRVLIYNLIFIIIIEYADNLVTITDDAVLYNSILSLAWCISSVIATILYFKYDWRNRKKKIIGTA